MINLKNLIELLPPIFKTTDPYQVNGKGLLERFLEIFGGYFEEVITPGIDNLLDVSCIDTTEPLYFNYLWELFGEIPFANSALIDKDQWDRYYDSSLSKEELKELSKNWLIEKAGTIVLSDEDTRRLLKYSLALIKIRGTKKFFETLFQYYGISCTISEVPENTPSFIRTIEKNSLSPSIWVTASEVTKLSAVLLNSANIDRSRVSYYIIPDVPFNKFGTANVNIQYVSGNNKLNLIGVDLLDTDGNIVYQDYHSGVAGNDHINNQFQIKAPNTGTYLIRVFINNSVEPVTATCNIIINLYQGFSTLDDIARNTPKLGANYCSLDDITLDLVPQYLEYTTIRVDISTNFYYCSKLGTLFVGNEGTYLLGKRIATKIDTEDGIHIYNKDESTLTEEEREILRGFTAFRRAIELIFDRYLPCHVKPIITYDGESPIDPFSIDINYLNYNQHIDNSNDEVVVKVDVSSRWANNSTKFQVSSDGINWSSEEYDSGYVFYIKNQGTWYFRCVGDHSTYEAITVSDLKSKHDNLPKLRTFQKSPINEFNSFINDSPVYYRFLNTHATDFHMVLTRDGEIIANEEFEVIHLETGTICRLYNPPMSYDYPLSVNMLKQGDNTFALLNNPEVVIYIKYIYALEPYLEDKTSREWKGLPYGISGKFTQIETHRNPTDKELSTGTSTRYLGEYGNYGPLLARNDFSGKTNRLGNVVVARVTEDTTFKLEVLARDLKPWAYKINNITGEPESVELTKIDVLINQHVYYPYVDLANRTFAELFEDMGDGDFKGTDLYKEIYINRAESLKDSNSLTTFYKVTTLTVKDGDTVDIANLISMSPFMDNYGIKGGLVLLHPNTQELLEKGIKPNYSPDSGDYWSNFLVIVVPPYISTQVPESKNYSKVSKWLYQYTDKSAYQVFNRYLPSSGDRTTEAYPDYLIGAPDNVEDIGLPYRYDRLSVTTGYDEANNSKPVKLVVDFYQNNLHVTGYSNPWLQNTNCLVFNLKSYNSDKDRYIPTYNYLDYPNTDRYSYDISELPWDNLDTENLSVLVLDLLAPGVYSQYMLRKRYIKERADGLYIKLVDYVPGLPPGTEQFEPWYDLILQRWNIDDEGYVRVVRTNSSTGELLYNIPLSAGYTTLYKDKPVVKETVAKPARVQFVMYQGNIEWDMDYYLLDSTGKKYLPGVTYYLNDIKDYIFAVVPNTDVNFDKTSLTKLGQYCITINNYIQGNDLVRVDLGISNPTFVVTDTSGKFSIKTRVHPISNHLLPIEYVNKIRIYECENYNPVTHDYILGRQVGSSFIYTTEDFTPREVLLVATMTIDSRLYILGDPVKFTIINPKAV